MVVNEASAIVGHKDNRMRYIIYQKLNKKHWYISMLSRILLIPYILNFQMKLAAESKRGEKGQRVK